MNILLIWALLTTFLAVYFRYLLMSSHEEVDKLKLKYDYADSYAPMVFTREPTDLDKNHGNGALWIFVLKEDQCIGGNILSRDSTRFFVRCNDKDKSYWIELIKK